MSRRGKKRVPHVVQRLPTRCGAPSMVNQPSTAGTRVLAGLTSTPVSDGSSGPHDDATAAVPFGEARRGAMSGGRVGALVAMAAVVAASAGCGGGGGGEKIIPLAGSPTTVATTTGGPVSTAPIGLSAADVANRFEQLLEQNNGARAQVTSSVQGVSSCSSDPTYEHNQLGGVITGRRNLLTELDKLDVRALSEGDNLKSNLSQAWQQSIEADV